MSETRYTKDHEWVRLESDGTATVGITDHAQQALGDVVYVELPEPGRDVVQGEAVAVVESVKAASEIYAPLAGTITDVNETLTEDPALANRAPDDEGWFFRMTPADDAGFEELMDETEYASLVDGL